MPIRNFVTARITGWHLFPQPVTLSDFYCPNILHPASVHHLTPAILIPIFLTSDKYYWLNSHNRDKTTSSIIYWHLTTAPQFYHCLQVFRMILPCPSIPGHWQSEDVDYALALQQVFDHIKNVHPYQNNKEVEDLDTGQILR